MSRRRSLLVLVLLVLLVAVACSQGDARSQTANTTSTGMSPVRLPASWDPAAVGRVDALGRRVSNSLGRGACSTLRQLRPQSLQRSYDRFAWSVVPSSVADCDAGDEILELAVFSSAARGDAYVHERTRSLCRAAAASATELPPFAWVMGARWTVQADRARTARAIANDLDARTSVRRCDLANTLGWSPRGVATVRKLGSKVVSAGCSGVALVDRERTGGSTDRSEVPSALATCTLLEPSTTTTPGSLPGRPAARGMVVAAFDRRSVGLGAFVDANLSAEACGGTPTSAVVGDHWVVLAPSEIAERVAKLVDGRVGRSCPE